MAKKYGGVDNKKTIQEIEEAVLIDDSPHRDQKVGIPTDGVFTWLMIWLATKTLVDLALAITGLSAGVCQWMPYWLQHFLGVLPVATIFIYTRAKPLFMCKEEGPEGLV